MKDIGILGLGVMGKSLALNFVNKGFGVAVYNIPMPGEEQVVRNFVQKNDAQNFFGGDSILDFLNHLKSPRKVLLMVKSGAPVDSVIQKLIPHLNMGVIIIDVGNSFFKDTIRREKELSNVGIHYVGMGVSGGEKGALLGPSMMPAGSQEIKNELMPLFEKVAAQKDGEPCVAWVGENGAGHFVKMVHNGIEYADMQILSEYYSILKNICGLSNEAIADFMAEGKETLQDSYLLDITVKILRHKENGKPTLDQILDVAGHKGTGLWTVKEALDLGVPIPSISTAMNARILSGQKPLRER
jgi:6-phosphogluconate dehydrogenase